MLLNWGHYDNLLWSWQVTQVIPVVIVLGLLLTIVRFGTQLTGWASISSGVAVAALPLCGVPGLAYVPGFALWLAEVGRQSWRAGSTTGRRNALIVWALAAVAIFLVPIYFIDLTTSANGPFRLLRSLKTMVAFVAQGLGRQRPRCSRGHTPSFSASFCSPLPCWCWHCGNTTFRDGHAASRC